MAKYRILILTSPYPAYIYHINSQLATPSHLSYNEIKKKYWDDFCDLRYHYYFNKIGQTSEVIITNYEYLQKLWAKEHNIQYREKKWLEDIVLEQIKKYEPDIIYILDLDYYSKDFIPSIRLVMKNDVCITCWKCSLIRDIEVYEKIDLVFTCNYELLKEFVNHEVPVAFVNHGFDHEILGRTTSTEKKYDCTFAGTLSFNIHSQRIGLINDLMLKTPLELWVRFGSQMTLMDLISSRNMIIRDRSWTKKIFEPVFYQIKKRKIFEKYPGLNQHQNRIHPALFGRSYFELIKQSKIALNVHGDIGIKYASNRRLFEIAGMGTCMVTDWKENLTDYYEPGYEIITYTNHQDCIQKVRETLKDEDLILQMGKAAQKKTLNKYTLEKKVKNMDEILLTMIHN